MKRKTNCIYLLLWLLACSTPDQKQSGDWPVYQGVGSNQYAALDEITPQNVSQLEVAWTYRSGDAAENDRSQIQCNPLIIDGIVYASTPSLKFVALDGQSGEPIWEFDPFQGQYEANGMGVNRGVMHWTDGTESRMLCTAGAFLYSLDAETGQADTAFGDGGRVDLHTGLGEAASDKFVVANSPGVVFEDLLILGTRVSESNGAAPGYIRAFHVTTGALIWTFYTIPRPGEYGADTWPSEALTTAGGANSWAGMTLDAGRGVVYIPTGSASYDFYGGNRHGQNLFANCILALDARTGKRQWHYQFVRHDLWDRDLPAPPNLLTITHEGKKRDVIAQITKSGYVFVLDRDTGEPVFPIEELDAPASDLPGEQAWPSQPLPTAPPPFSRQTLADDDINPLAPNRDELIARLSAARKGHPFMPPSREGTLIFPGYDGGGEWGGAAANPHSGIMYVNSSQMAWILTMIPVREKNDQMSLVEQGEQLYLTNCAACHGANRQGASFMGEVPALTDLSSRKTQAEISSIISKGQGVMPAFGHLEDADKDALIAYLMEAESKEPSEGQMEEATGFVSTGYHRLVDADGNPAITPPWGLLTAIDLNAGTKLWEIPLGDVPAISARTGKKTGTENYGGPLVTASGLVFIAATRDARFRAFSASDGQQLWETELPAGGYATPATYTAGGRQYVIVAAGGGKMGTPSGDAWLAYALPQTP